MAKGRKAPPADSRDLVGALRRVGVNVLETAQGLQMTVGDGATLTVRPVSRSVLSAGRAADAVRVLSRDEAPGLALIIADKIPAPAREVLNKAGIGWFDRRGHIRVTAPGVLIDTDVPAAPARRDAPRFPSGRTGAGTAVALLAAEASLGEGEAFIAPTVREIAELAEVAVSGASTALKTFRQLGYLNGDGSPVVPDLFWATVEQWAPRWVPLTKAIDSDAGLLERLDANLDDLDLRGWSLGGDHAAAAWHAPIVGGDIGPRQWYVPTAEVLDALRWTLGEPAPGQAPADFVAVAPTPVVCHRRVRLGRVEPIEPLVAAALDLALDQARGPETLEGWDPDNGRRVW